MTYEAVVRRQTFAQSPGAQELHVRSVVYGEVCGHAHSDPRDADRCINKLADRVGLKLYDSCIVREIGAEPLSHVDRALLYGLYEEHRKRGGAQWPT